MASTQLCVPISISENIVSYCHTFGSTESALLSLPLPWSPSPEASGYIFQDPDQSQLWAGLPKLGWWFSIESFSCYLLIWDKGPSFAHWSHESLLIIRWLLPCFSQNPVPCVLLRPTLVCMWCPELWVLCSESVLWELPKAAGLLVYLFTLHVVSLCPSVALPRTDVCHWSELRQGIAETSPWTGNPGRLTFCQLQLGPPCPEGGSHIYSWTVFPAPSLCQRCDGCWQHKRDRTAVSPSSLWGFGPAHRSGVGAWAPTHTLSSHCSDDYENMTRIVFYGQKHLFWEFQQNDRSSPLFVLRLFALSRLDNPEDSYWFSHCVSPLNPSRNSCVQMDAPPPGLSQHLSDTPEEHFLTWMVTVCGSLPPEPSVGSLDERWPLTQLCNASISCGTWQKNWS